MEEGRESPPSADDQQTTEEESSDSTSVRQSDSPESTEGIGDQQGAVDIYEGDQCNDFREAIEPFFTSAERAITHERFDLTAAKDLVMKSRDLGLRYEARGCTESSLEEAVVKRALKTVYQLMDGVNLNQEEAYDPRQTTVYLYCAMAVFPCTVRLERNPQGILLYRFSISGSACSPQLAELSRFCALKTRCSGDTGWMNQLQHQQVMLDLACWLEVDMAPVAYMMSTKSLPVLSSVISETRIRASLPAMSAASERGEKLWEMNAVVAASSLVREGLVREAKDYHKVLSRVDIGRLPSYLASRHAYVHACLLHNCQEFGKALCIARDALAGVTNLEERREFEQLINNINNALETARERRNTQGPADPQWLEGTFVSTNESRTYAQEAARQSYLAQTSHKKVRKVSVRRRGQTPSPGPLSRQAGGSARNTQRDGRSRSFSSCRQSNVNLSLYTQPARSSTCSAGDRSRGNSVPPAFSSSRENLLDDSNWDDSSDDQDEEVYDAEEEICYHYLNDQDTDFVPEANLLEATATDQILSVEEQVEGGPDWFETSEEALRSGENGEGEEEDENVILSERQSASFNKSGHGGRTFYNTLYRGAEAEQLLRNDPKKFVHCQIKIERAHRAVAKVLSSRCKYTEILIDGRSKANQTYMDDEVVVEITAEPGGNRGLQQGKGAGPAGADDTVEKMPHGKVVGLLKRVNYNDVDHPVLFCTLDEIEGHLMRPLCKTVPKIHVLNERVRKKFPALKKNRIELNTINPEGEVVHTGFLNVQPDKREQYVFKVVILAWRQQTIYPLGAVLDYHIGGRDYAGGLKVLSMQQRVPRRYPRAAVENTKVLIQQTLSKTGRQDLTKQRVFTIDPPGSKDLDDAVSIQKKGTHYVIGVHIADVAAQVPKGSGVDEEARRRAVTFYPLNRKPHAMLPEPLSHGKCSLLQDQERLALSVFFTFNEKGKQVEEPIRQKTVIKSCCQLTYEEAQKVIDGKENVNVDPLVQEDIRQLHKITSKLKKMRLKNSMLFVPFEDPRLPELERMNEHIEAHSLIEELMILANSSVATYLTRLPRYQDVMLIRCHKAPTWEELADWRDTEGSVTDLVMQLQGKQFTPSGTQLSFDASANTAGAARQRQNVLLQKEVWGRLCRYLEDGAVTEAQRLAFMDALHPLQCLANCRWMDLMETAQYRCYFGLNRPDVRHFGLNLDVYTHFTSPIRRYADVYVQRLLHAAFDNSTPDSTPDEVTALCQHINSATSRQKAFGKGCMSLRVSEGLQRQPLLFRAYVDKVDDEQLTVCVPSLLKVSDRKQELPFSMLGVSSQPELVTDTALRRDTVTVQWTKRIYDVRQTCHGSLMTYWKHLERTERSGNRPASAPIKMTLRPDMNSVAVKHQDWARILQALTSSRTGDVPMPVERVQQEVEHMSSEKGDGKVSLRPIQFIRQYTKGQVVQIQLSAEPKKGMLQPRVELLHTARNTSVCTPHVTDPVRVLTRFATRATRDQNFSGYGDYLQAWMPLLEMEAAMDAGDSDGGVVIENVNVTMKTQGASNSIKYRGYFSLKASFCYDRCIEFGGKSADSIRQEEFKTDNRFPLDYLCIRYTMKSSDVISSRVQASGMAETVDKNYTWLAHGSVAQVIHEGRKSKDGGNLVVTFVLSSSSPQPPPQLMSREGAKVTIEILPKTEVDRRAQEMLLVLSDPEYELAHAIAHGSKIPKLESTHRKLGKQDVNHEVTTPHSRRLPPNNPPQLAAIQMAMKNSLAIIQGPPGSGKTNTGIKLVYLFCKVNRQVQADGKGKKTVLYCGPSNKSVDLVARELKSKLGPMCPKIVRMYGSAIESKDYPVPRGDLRSTRGMRDLKCDPDLQDVALHHLIRRDGKPYAEDIAVFEKYFDKCNKEPEKYSVSNKQLKKYRELVFKASVDELKHYEVILATCAVGGCRRMVEGTADTKDAKSTVFQLIIDECGMSPEPHSMVPIIATKAKQVVLIGDHKQLRPIIKCQPAAELGLDQSLFERLFMKFSAYTVFLSTQYRMHPEICAFPSKEFYENKLKTGYSLLWGGDLLPFWPQHPLIQKRQVPHLLINVRGVEETLTVTTDQGNERSKSNSLEAEKVIEILTFLKRVFKVDLLKVKLLTQYNAQRHLLEEKVKQAIEQNKDVFEHYDKFKVNVSTVVSSQGGEWDYVILSTVRSLPSYLIEPNPTHGWCRQNLGFITDRNQVNVALTRARRGLFIVGNVELLRCDDVWRHLVERYELLGCSIDDPSLFPPPPAPRRRAHHRRVQHNASENWQRV